MTRTKKILLFVLVLVLLLVAGFFTLERSGSRSFSTDTTIRGAYTVDQGDSLTLKNGARLTITGDLTVKGTVFCEKGPVTLFVAGTVQLEGRILCDDGAVLIKTAGLTSLAQTEVSAQDTIAITDDPTGTSITPSALMNAYDEVGKNTGDHTRFGPFVEGTPTRNIDVVELEGGGANPNVVIRGSWRISEHDASVSPDTEGTDTSLPFLFAVTLSPSGSLLLDDLHVQGQSVNKGIDDIGKNCTARGKDGAHGLHIRIDSGMVNTKNTFFELGGGGDGGNAETKNTCPEASAQGGAGGSPGNMKITAIEKLVFDDVRIVIGTSGRGGDATAYGENGTPSCPGGNGGNARAIGGNGGTSPGGLSVMGSVTGLETIRINRIVGGDGGNARAFPGKGGAGEQCGCGGGNGGNAEATGGRGGNANIALLPGTGEAHGGSGGDGAATGGAGGAGGSCTNTDQRGGNGGTGGDSVAIAGLPGSGTTADGRVGQVRNTSGGDGGRGGDGCPRGMSGGGGLGTPIGQIGQPGTDLCPGSLVTPTSTPITTVPLIKAVLYRGKYLPIDQLIITDAPGCGERHWRSVNGSVRATDGTVVPDPNFSCGYGKTREAAILDTPATVITVDVKGEF